MRICPSAAVITLVLTAVTSAGYFAMIRSSGAPRPPTAASAPQIPMWFERNTGEFPSQVQFASRSLDQTVFLTANEMVVATSGGQPLSIEWRKAKPARRMAGEHPLQARVDYFRGADRSKWKAGTSDSRFGQVRYEQVYQGIDLVFHPQGDQLEHDFVVAPGVDPKQIALRFHGASTMKLDADGSLALQVGNSEIRQSKPVAYQEIAGKRVEVAANYRVSGDREIEFELGSYDPARELVIDPVLKYATYIGGSRRSTPARVIAEPGGILWIAGSTTSVDFPAAGDPIRAVETSGGSDIFLVKIDPSKSGIDSLLYAAVVGGTGADEARALALDRDGNAVIVGTTASADFPIVGSYDIAIESGRDAVVVKIDPRRAGEAALVYTTFLGGDNDDVANAVTTDNFGRIIVTGYTISENFPLTANAIQRNRQNGYELFITRIDPDAGTNGLQYSTYFGGSGTDIGQAIAIDAQGLIYVAGSTSSSNFPVLNAYQSTYQNAGDMFLIRIDPDKSGLDGINYGSYFGGSGIDSAEAMQLDAQGNVNIVGYTTSRDMPIAGSAPQTRNAGGADAFVLKIAIPSNNLSFATYLGGSASDVAYGMSLDAQGRIHISGYTYSTDFNVTRNALQPKLGGGYDAFMASINPSLPAAESLLYSSYWGGSGNENGITITADSNCVVSLVGLTTGKKLPVTNSAFQPEGAGFPDTFLASVNICQ